MTHTQDMNEVANFQDTPDPYDACFLVDHDVDQPTNTTNKPQPTPTTLQCYTMHDLQHNYTFSKAQWQAINPPYAINHRLHSAPLGVHTLSMAAQRRNGELEYNTHQLYGLTEVIATHAALRALMPGRPFVLTRSSFLGMLCMLMVSVVCLWCVCGVCVVCLWCVCGVCVVCVSLSLYEQGGLQKGTTQHTYYPPSHALTSPAPPHCQSPPLNRCGSICSHMEW